MRRDLDKLKEFSSYAIEGFTSGDTVVVIGSGPLGLLHVAKADMMGAGQIIATDLAEDRLTWARRCGAEHVLNASTTTAQERIERVRELTNGRGADVVLHMANTPKSFVEGIEMLKRGGMMLEMGNFADTGEISLNVHRHICSKNIRLIGLTNHPSTGYGPALRLLERYSDRYPFAEMVTQFGLPRPTGDEDDRTRFDEGRCRSPRTADRLLLVPVSEAVMPIRPARAP